MMRKLFCLTVLAAAMSLAHSAPAHADTLVFNGWSSLTNGQTVTINGQGGIWAGEIDWTLNPGTSSASLFRAYCVDLYDDAITGSVGQSGTLKTIDNLNSTNSTGVTQPGARAAWLVNTYGTGSSAAAAAGLQIAIWEALYGTQAFTWSASTATTTFANTFYQSLLNANPTSVLAATGVYFDVNNIGTSGHGQDQIRIGTPEPAPVLLLIFAFATWLATQRRLKRRALRA